MVEIEESDVFLICEEVVELKMSLCDGDRLLNICILIGGLNVRVIVVPFQIRNLGSRGGYGYR